MSKQAMSFYFLRAGFDHSDLLHSYKLKVDACEKNSVKYHKLFHIGVNYLYVADNTIYLKIFDADRDA
jgi:hypothetical protein